MIDSNVLRSEWGFGMSSVIVCEDNKYDFRSVGKDFLSQPVVFTVESALTIASIRLEIMVGFLFGAGVCAL